MWRLYDELIAGIPPGIAVSSYNIACRWTTVVAGGTPASPTRRMEGAPAACTAGP